MNQKAGPFQIVKLPAARRELPDLLDVYWWKHFVYGLLEVDVTIARQYIAQYKAMTGEVLSFTGYLVTCLAHAVDEDKSVQAYLKGRRQLVVFEDVDVSMAIERQVGGTRVPVVYVIRHANQKTFREIHAEIRMAQSQPVPASKGISPPIRFAMSLPQPLPKLTGVLMRAITRRDPTLLVAYSGTVGVTSVGMFGQRGGWGIANIPHTLSLAIGGIARKPAVVDNRIEPRELLSLTLAFDHDIVDGAPAARFARRLVELIESGYGLDEEQSVTAIFNEIGARKAAVEV